MNFTPTQPSEEIIIRSKEFPDLVVDRNRGTLINTNFKKLSQYKQERERLKQLHNKMERMENELIEMRNLFENFIKQAK